MGEDRDRADTTTQERAHDPLRITDRDAYLLVALEICVVLLWAFWRALGVDLEVRAEDGTREVTLVAIVITTTLAALASFLLLRVLRRRGLRIWTTVAATAALLSCAGPLLASTLSAGIALLTFHLLVGVGIIDGVRYLHQDRSSR